MLGCDLISYPSIYSLISQADETADEVQQWYATAKAAGGMWAVVLALLALLLLVYAPIHSAAVWLLPTSRWLHAPTVAYAVAVVTISQRVLEPVCLRLNDLEKHSTKVRRGALGERHICFELFAISVADLLHDWGYGNSFKVLLPLSVTQPYSYPFTSFYHLCAHSTTRRRA